MTYRVRISSAVSSHRLLIAPGGGIQSDRQAKKQWERCSDKVVFNGRQPIAPMVMKMMMMMTSSETGHLDAFLVLFLHRPHEVGGDAV